MTSEGHVGFLKGVFATLAAIAALIAIYEFFLKNYINVPQFNVQPTSAQISQQPTLGAAIPTTSQGANSNPTTQPPVAVQPTTSGDDVGGYIPMSPEEAASLFGGPPAKVWKQCPGEPLGACWIFALPGTAFRLTVPRNCLRPDGSIDGWRYLGGNPGPPDSIQGTTRIWNSLEAASIRCH